MKNSWNGGVKLNMKTYKRTVKEVFWHPNTKGVFVPFIHFDKVKKGSKICDSLPLKGLEELSEKECGKGSEVKLGFDEELKYGSIDTLTKSLNFQVPSKCPHCKRQTVSTDTDVLCINHVCTANSRGTLYRLYTACTLKIPKHEDVMLIAEWLNQFPANGSYAEVDGIFDFLVLFNQESDLIGTEKRASALREVLKEGADTIAAFEKDLLEWLRKGPKPGHFWYSMNLPLKDKDRELLKDLKPTSKMKTLSSDARDLLKENFKFIDAVWREFYCLSK